jgi:CheY-like chemotaxis protein
MADAFFENIFENLSVLLVEDNTFNRDLISNILKQLGFSHVHTVKNGEEAISFLKQSNVGHGQSTHNLVDVIVSDLRMSPVDGMVLLRWVRNHDHSPNRFIPFVMISGAADQENVRMARELGATEFIAKPFSVESIYKRLWNMVANHRRFVCSKDYFGPDRRRRTMGLPADVLQERRKPLLNRASIVAANGQVVQPDHASNVWIFDTPNSLETKIKTGSVTSVPFSKQVLQRAEAALKKEQPDFTKWAFGYLTEIDKLVTKAEHLPTARTSSIQAINDIAHDLRGQGGTFGYQLVTVLAESLYKATEPGVKMDAITFQVIRAHSDSLKAVFREKIKGDGGTVGRALLKAFEKAIQRAKDMTIDEEATARNTRQIDKLIPPVPPLHID